MTFLNHRREKPGDSARHADSRPSDSRKRRKAIKEADAEAVISRYFTAAKAPNGDAMNPRVRQEHDEEVRMSRGHDSPPPFVELPDRPFLGFGSCGANSSISPVKPLEVFEPRDIGRRQIRSPTRSTSYPTWSQSGAPLQSSLPLVRQEPLPLESSKLSNSEGVSPKPYTTGNSMPSRSSRGHHRLSTETRDASHNTKLRQRAPTDFHNPGKILPCEAQLIINTQDQDHKEDQAAESGCSNITKTRKTVSAGDRTRIGNPSEGKDAIQHSPLGAAARQGSKPRSKSPTRAQEVNIALGWRPTNTMYHEHFSYLDAELDALLQEFVPSAQRTLSLNARDSCREVPRTVAKNSVKRTQDCNFIVDHSSIRHDFTEPNLGVLLSSDQSSKPHGPKFHDVSPGTVRKSAHTLSRRSVDSFNRPDIAACTTDRQTPPVHPGVDFRSAWNGSETLYGRQEEQVGSVLDDFRHNISAQETEARTEDGRPRATDDQPLLVSSEPLFSGLQEINDFHNHEHGLYEAQHRVHENGNHAKEEPLNNDNFDDNCVYYKPLNAPNEDHFVEDHGMIHATSIVEEDDNEIRENEMIVGRDLTYQQTGLFENEIFDRSMSFTNPCRRPRLQAHTFDNRRRPGEFVEGEPEDPALSGFWTPHKLY